MTTTTLEPVVEETTQEDVIMIHAACNHDINGLYPALCGFKIFTVDQMHNSASKPVTCTVCIDLMPSTKPCVACGSPVCTHWWCTA